MRYLDNAATTAVHPAVADEIDRVMRGLWANPSSLYAAGMEAEDCICAARATLGRFFGLKNGVSAQKPEVVFTASGTEASNIGVLGAARARRGWGRHIVLTGYEHPCVANAVKYLCEQEGFSATVVKPDETGTVDADALVDAVGGQTALVCAMHVNNETGAVLDVAALAARVKAKNSRTAVHVDGVQAFLKLPLDLPATAIDTYGVSGHKLHAPKGVGALYIRKGFDLLPPLAGGSQEGGRRPGTENTPYIAGFAKAALLYDENRAETAQTIEKLSHLLKDGLAEIDGITLNSPENAVAGIVNFSVLGLKSEVVLHFLEQKGILVSSGSACAKGERSHTLTAMGLSGPRLDGAVRVSFAAENTQDDVVELINALKEACSTLAKGRPGQRRRA